MINIKRGLTRLPAWLLSGLTLIIIAWLTLAPHPLGEKELPLFPGADKIAHALMFGFLTAMFMLDRQRRNGWLKVSGAFCTGMIALSSAIGIGTEYLQRYMHVGRGFETMDMAADFGGALVCGLIYFFMQTRWAQPLLADAGHESHSPDNSENGPAQEKDSGSGESEENPEETPGGKPKKKHLIKPRWLRVTLKTLGWLLLVVLLLPVLIYVPPVQTLLKNVAQSVVYKSTGMKVTIDKFRLKFPVDVSLQGVTVLEASGDTMVNAKEVIADVKLLPLIDLDVKLNRLKLIDGYYRMVSPDSSMIMKIRAGLLDVDGHSSANIKKSEILLNKAFISDGDVSLYMDVWKKKPSSADSTSTPFLIKANSLKLENFRFAMSMLPTIDTLTMVAKDLELSRGIVDLRNNVVQASYLSAADGDFKYLAPTPEYVKTHPAPVDTVSPPSPPMIIRGDQVALDRFNVVYGIKGAKPMPGFDANYISLTDVGIGLDNFFNKASEVRLPITRLKARERCGLAVTSGKGLVSIDSIGLDFKGLDVTTPLSKIYADANVPFALMEMKPDAEMRVLADASVAPSDIVSFMPSLKAYTSKLPSNAPARLQLKADGSISALEVGTLCLNVPRVLDLAAKGNVKNPLDMKKMQARLVFDGSVTGPETIKEIAGLKEIDLPALSLSGTATADRQVYSADFKLLSEAGNIVGDGLVSLTAENYDADIDIDNFEAGRFLPGMELGNVTAHITAHGAGFNPSRPGAHTDADISIVSAGYKGHEYQGIKATAMLSGGDFNVSLVSPDPLLNITLDANGTVAPDDYSFNVKAHVNHADLQALGFTPDICSGNGDIHLTGTASPERWLYDATLTVDSFDWNLSDGYIHLPDGITATLLATAADVRAHIDSDRTSLDFSSASGLKNVVDRFTALGPVIARQIAARHLEVEELQQSLPPFNLAVNASGNGLIRQFLTATGMSIDTVYADFSNDSILQGNAYVGSLNTGSMTLDTLSLSLRQRGSLIDYKAHLGNIPGNMDEFSKVNANGYVGGNRVSLFLTQQNLKGETGYKLGMTGAVTDSLVTVHFSPLRATIAYLPWTLNADNHVDYNLSNSRIDANLKAQSAESSILLMTETDEKGVDELHVNLQNIKIQDFLSMSVFAPPIKASINSDLRVSNRGKAIIANGNVQVNDFTYNKMRVGNFDLDIKAGMGSKGNSGGRAALKIDGKEALVLRGVLRNDSAGGGIRPENVKLELTEFPLKVANPFLGKEVAQLHGALNGEMALSGSFSEPLLNGQITPDSVRVFIPMIGSSLRFDEKPLTVADNLITFDKFNIWGQNDNPLTIDGTVDARKFSDIRFNIGIDGQNVELINNDKRAHSEIYGKLFVNLSASARGPMKHFDVNANLNILNTTDIYYQLQTDAQTLVEQRSDGEIVKFVVFSDTTQVAAADSVQNMMAMRILANLNIAPGTQATVLLSTNGTDRVELTPSGSLNYFMNYMGDQRLTGQLVLGNGFARYSLPVMGEKKFVFEPESYVLWNGELMNPVLNIKAYDMMKVNVVQSSGNSQLVNFRVGLDVSQTLSSPTVKFDLSADDDLSIQNELSSMSPDQRSTAAMNLLITKQYTGPGTKTASSSMGNMANNALYGFLTSQINSWAANNIRGVDLSFGVDQYNQTRNGQNSTTTSYSYQVSKSLFNNKFKIVVGGNYSTDASADENFAQNLLSDISFEYMLKQTNTLSMYLKLFRHNGFESIVEGEVTETGVGFVMRRRMSNLRQLFRLGHKKRTEQKERQDSTNIQTTDEQ